MIVNTCSLCGGNDFAPFLDLGFTALADRFLTRAQLDQPEVVYPLVVRLCRTCKFVHISYVVPPEILYQEDYPYESSMTATGRRHFFAFAASVVDDYGLTGDDLAVDIGSNVGVLLKGFQDRHIRVLGVEPAGNIAEIAVAGGIPTISDFFSPTLARRIAKEHGKAKVITGANVFAHIDDKKGFFEAADALLTPDGIVVLESPYFVHLLENLEYDTIYHEHLSYISLTPLASFLKQVGFALFDIKQVDIHGGSIRMFIAREGQRAPTPAVLEALAHEEAEGIHSLERLERFAADVAENRRALTALLRSLKEQGKRIAAVSAPAKGMTLLNYCKIGDDLLDFITEKSTLKIGRYAPGSHLPILPDAALVERGVDYALLLAWNFKDEIMSNLREFREAGGRFIIPIPKPVII